MDSARRYNSGAAAFCGLLGAVILTVVACRAGVQDDRFLTIFRLAGLCGGWILGATYAYFLFFDENGTAKPNTMRIQASVLKWRRRMCATGLHSWEKWIHTKTCRVCGKRQVI